MFTKANAARSGGQDKDLTQMINGSKLDAVDYRRHIETIVNNNYTKINKIPEFPDVKELLDHVSKSHKIGEKTRDTDSRFPKKTKSSNQTELPKETYFVHQDIFQDAHKEQGSVNII